MKHLRSLMLTAGFLGCAPWVGADFLELKNGTTLNGKYVGGSAGTVRFETSAGVQLIETSQAVALEEKQQPARFSAGVWAWRSPA